MKNKNPSKHYSTVESSYRTLYGKLFAALLNQFGVAAVTLIEDAIQNAFYKSLKSWKPNKIPDNKENWLYVVAKNDLINQLKKVDKKIDPLRIAFSNKREEGIDEDLRLQTILLFAGVEEVSRRAKILFLLKNLFGLHVKEISQCTLLHQDAIYKSIYRAKGYFKIKLEGQQRNFDRSNISNEEIELVEEILYAVFNIGFDSFKEDESSIVNDDLCLESLALAKILWKTFNEISTQNLMALFCFHLARLPAKVIDRSFIPFFDQEKDQWNSSFFKLGFHYLKQPKKLNQYYIEALITSKHMTVESRDTEYWRDIIHLYKLLYQITNSPIVKVNWCYALSKGGHKLAAIQLLKDVEKSLPEDHFYYLLVKADLLKEINVAESDFIINQTIKNMQQKIRINHLLKLSDKRG